MHNKKVLFIITEGSYFISHRLDLAKYAIKKNFDVALASNLSAKREEIIKIRNLKSFNWTMKRGTTNIFSNCINLFKLWVIFIKFKPDIINSVGLQPILYSSLILKFYKNISHTANFAGLGYLFISKKKSVLIIRYLITKILKFTLVNKKTKIIVQNKYDFCLLESYKLINKNNSYIIQGSGVDTNKFMPHSNTNKKIFISFASRLLWDKGVGDFIKISRIFEKKKINVLFCLVGRPDYKNPNSISENDLNKWSKYKNIKILGHSENMNEVFDQTLIFCLPSYREGLPKVLIEAASCGIPIVTYDVPGCNDVVIDKVNGYLIPFKDTNNFASKIEKLLNNYNDIKNFGNAGRELVLEKFSKEIINNKIIDIWE